MLERSVWFLPGNAGELVGDGDVVRAFAEAEVVTIRLPPVDQRVEDVEGDGGVLLRRDIIFP